MSALPIRTRGGSLFARRRNPTGQAIVEFALVLPVAMALIFGISDFARLYTTAISVESAVREAADYGAFQGSNWLPANVSLTEASMMERACTATSTLPDYSSTDPNHTCTNPTVTYVLENPDGIDCSQPVPNGDLPCVVHVKAHYDFKLFFSSAVTVPIDRETSYVVNDFPSP